MQKNLVIVESPAKAKTIEKFLGKDFKVMSSYGHIRDLKKKELSIDDETLEPEYEIPEEKEKLVADLRSKAAKAERVWLASDEDREGEAISWHLCEVLGLDKDKTSRIVFHEITKPAILEAIEHPRHLDMNLVNAQQARRVLDRIVGFKLSPVLWRKVKLDYVYAICWLDAIHYKVKDDTGRAVTRAIYNVLGINKEGHKELLGMYVAKSEGANFWLDVLTDLQNRGVEDIMICCVDGLKGFPDAIQSVFPNTAVQLCIVHQIRNSIKYVGSKHQKEFMKDLKLVYGAVSKEAAETELDNLEAKWGEQYPIVIKSWRDNWERLTEFFQYTKEIRRLIYTTNTVEGYHRQIRKVTKNKGVFPSDTALEKLVYLAYRNISEKWTMPLANWALISQQLAIKFGDRFEIM